MSLLSAISSVREMTRVQRRTPRSIGIVNDTDYENLREAAPRQIYLCAAQHSPGSLVYVRTTQDSRSAFGSIRKLAHELDQDGGFRPTRAFDQLGLPSVKALEGGVTFDESLPVSESRESPETNGKCEAGVADDAQEGWGRVFPDQQSPSRLLHAAELGGAGHGASTCHAPFESGNQGTVSAGDG
jgi:hypothetical protein